MTAHSHMQKDWIARLEPWTAAVWVYEEAGLPMGQLTPVLLRKGACERLSVYVRFRLIQ